MTQGTRLTDRAEVLNRQVHPKALDGAKGALRTAFTPSDTDQGLLSTLRGRVAPDEAYERHIALGLESAGTWPVEVGHACDQNLACVDDASSGYSPADHASVDFSVLPVPEGVSEKAVVRQAARKLAERANELGPLHAP